MQLLVAFSFFLLGLTAWATDSKLTPFQKNIKLCLKNQLEPTQLKNLNNLYESLDKRFALRTTETIYREVLFKEKKELKKLKLTKGKIALYKILSDKTIQLIDDDARQKGLTEDSAMNQLLVHADIQSDWLKVKETRAEHTTLYYSRQQGLLVSLTFEIEHEKLKLECLNINLSDICLCRP